MSKKNFKFKERVKRLLITPFNYTVYVIVSNDVRQSAAKREIATDRNWFAMHVHTDDAPVSLIILPHDCGVTTVAHEVSHCVWAIMRLIGAEHENEVMAYTHGHITGEVCKFLNQYKPGGWKTILTRRPSKRDKLSRQLKTNKFA